VAAALDHGAANLTDAVRQARPEVTDGPVFGAVDGGYIVLVDELVRRARPRWVQKGVKKIESADHGWALRDDAGTVWHADGVILAVPASQLAPLVDGIAPRTAAAAAAKIVCASSAVVALAVPPGTPFPECSGVLVADDEPLRVKAITLSSRKWGFSGVVELLRLSFGRIGDTLATRASDEELLAWAVEDLSTVFGVAVAPVDVRVRRWLDVMPQYSPEHADVVAQIRAGLPPTLAVAGNYLDGVGVPACIAAAGRAVMRILGQSERL
jgi:oxygen-dependent protoporphyrinogen oxidase